MVSFSDGSDGVELVELVALVELKVLVVVDEVVLELSGSDDAEDEEDGESDGGGHIRSLSIHSIVTTSDASMYSSLRFISFIDLNLNTII